MANPQQPELARNRKVPALAPDATEAVLSATDAPTEDRAPGGVPEDNAPGHHPDVEQDKPSGDDFVAKAAAVAGGAPVTKKAGTKKTSAPKKASATAKAPATKKAAPAAKKAAPAKKVAAPADEAALAARRAEAEEQFVEEQAAAEEAVPAGPSLEEPEVVGGGSDGDVVGPAPTPGLAPDPGATPAPAPSAEPPAPEGPKDLLGRVGDLVGQARRTGESVVERLRRR